MATASASQGDPTDVVGRRFAAFLIDAVLLGVLFLALFAALRYRSYTGVHVDACATLRKGPNPPLCLKVGSRVFLWHLGALKLAVLVTLFAGFLDGVVLQSITGSSVGKLCWRLSVVDEDGEKARPLRMFGRWVFLVVDLGFFLVGCVSVLATHPHRRVGDFVFGTYVVAVKSVGRSIASDASSDQAASAVGSPSAWTAPPAPSPVKTPLASSAAAMPPPLKTPPGTAPTTPGEWGAVARPAPLVRSPQWASPPPSESTVPPAVIESASSPKWAAPPVAHAAEPPDDLEPEVESETAPEPELEAESAEETAAVAELEPEVESETEAEPEPDSELSEWSPVATAKERRRSRRAGGANASAPGSADESWWEEALSSGDSEAGADET